jgi:hypothetical protein
MPGAQVVPQNGVMSKSACAELEAHPLPDSRCSGDA